MTCAKYPGSIAPVAHRVLCILSALALGGCAGPRYLNRDIVTVAVLPPWNDSSMVEASGTLWPHVERESAKHGYRILPRAQVEAYFQKLRFGTPEEIQQIQPRKICADLGVQGLVYSHITFWGKTAEGLGFYVGVEFDTWIVDGSTGDKAWSGSGKAGKKGNDSIQGLIRSAKAIVGNPAEHAGKAAENAFKSAPLAGFEPKS